MISEEQESEGGLLRKEDKAEHSKWEKILPHTVQMHLFLTSKGFLIKWKVMVALREKGGNEA